MTDGQPSLQVLERAFGILDLFCPERPEWTTSEIGRASSLPVATVHRILAVLLRLGYVVRDERTRRFRLGAAAVDLGEETNVGAWGVAAPLLGAGGAIVAAVGLAGPSARLSRAEVEDHVRHVHAGAREIAAAFGVPEHSADAASGRRRAAMPSKRGENAWQ